MSQVAGEIGIGAAARAADRQCGAPKSAHQERPAVSGDVLINPRRNHYSFEWAADQATHPMVKSALLLEAAKVHRQNARARIALAKSHGWAKDGPEYTRAYRAIDWAMIAVGRAIFNRRAAA